MGRGVALQYNPVRNAPPGFAMNVSIKVLVRVPSTYCRKVLLYRTVQYCSNTNESGLDQDQRVKQALEYS